jgi:hypothetical protein
MNNTTQFETGATSHAVNELILYTDQTKELAELRDALYKSYDKRKSVRHFDKLYLAARNKYIKEFGNANSLHLLTISGPQIDEYCQLYVDDFENWKSEHGYK